MPGKNIIREYDTDAFYHIYNRGVEKRQIFLDDADYGKFLSIIKRHLGVSPVANRNGRPYEQYKEIELLAFCLMPNHFHLLVHQGEDVQAITKLLRSVGTAYSMYFNRKHKRVGHLFQERFRAARIYRDDHHQHISRYIHLNPQEKAFTYRWSSLPYYLGNQEAGWLHPERVLSMFDNSFQYRQFVQDYAGQARILGELKKELADT